MSKGIEVSPKHGLNPTIPVCFWCGKNKNEIAIMGRIREKTTNRYGSETVVRGSDVEAPRRMVLDYEPCDKCKAMFDQGVLLIGVTSTQPSDGRPPLTAQGGESVYPTGAHAVITTDAASRLFNIQREWKCGDKLFIDHEMLVQMTTPEDSEN